MKDSLAWPTQPQDASYDDFKKDGHATHSSADRRLGWDNRQILDGGGGAAQSESFDGEYRATARENRPRLFSDYRLGARS